MELEHTATLPGHAHAAAEQRRERTDPAALDSLQLESLVLNLDAALRVHTRAHFFTWAQGLLQSLIRHEVLVCALHGGDTQSYRVDSFATLATDAGVFGELFQRDAATGPGLLKAWKERGFLPVICSAKQSGALCGGAFGRELERIGATQVLAHGICDTRGQAGGFFIFACRPGTAGPKEAYLVQLVLPALHAAWVRTQIDGAAGERAAPVEARVLTLRELEILRWVYLGKSNFEVGAILKISPLTVNCLLYTSPSPRDRSVSRMPSSA